MHTYIYIYIYIYISGLGYGATSSPLDSGLADKYNHHIQQAYAYHTSTTEINRLHNNPNNMPCFNATDDLVLHKFDLWDPRCMPIYSTSPYASKIHTFDRFNNHQGKFL